jgi:hypothetical protein
VKILWFESTPGNQVQSIDDIEKEMIKKRFDNTPMNKGTKN